MEPKVLIGCPTSFHKEYCLKEYVDAVKKLNYNNYDFILVDNTSDDEYKERIESLGVKVLKCPYHERAMVRIVQSRNMLRDLVLNGGYEYFFSLEQDVIVKPDDLKDLISAKKDVVGGLYGKPMVDNPNKVKMIAFTEVDFDDEVLVYAKDSELRENYLLKVEMTGLGCLLIHRKIMHKVKFRWVEDSKCFDDYWFCKDLKDNGTEIFLCNKVIPVHFIKDIFFWRKIRN